MGSLFTYFCKDNVDAMISKKQLAFVRSLQQKKFRRENNCFVAEGAKIVPELLQSTLEVKEVYALPAWIHAHRQLLGELEAVEVNAEELSRLSGLVTANEVLALCEIPAYTLDPAQLAGRLSLVLDDIRDPGNLGTIIRIADWFGISDIVCSPETAEAWNPKVVQASMGSITRVKVHYTVLSAFIGEMKKINPALPVYGAFLDGENVYSSPLEKKGLLVIGNEAHGISAEIAALISKRISIPSFSAAAGKAGEAESLNAAIATAILCSEFRRR